MSHIYDVVVVGAGPAGSATAHSLTARGFDVLLLDKASFPRDKTCGDGLTPRAVHVLDEMGVLPQLLVAGCRLNNVRIIAPNGRVVNAALPHHGGSPDYTLVVPRLVLDDLLRQHAIASGTEFESSIDITELIQEGDRVLLRGTSHGHTIAFRGRMAVIATGASVKLLKNVGILTHTPPVALSSRAYFENVSGLSDVAHMSFAGLPLPGYGWVFPLSDGSANIGAGIVPPGRFRRRAAPRAPFETFVNTPQLQSMLANAWRVGPVKGFPIRTDFVRARTWGPRTLLVGEAAGLVNPLTAEGIDYALESGHLAADHLAHMFAADDFSPAQHLAYDRLLRERFQRLFLFCERMLLLCHSRHLLNLAVSAAARRPALKSRLIDVVLGNAPAPVRLSPATVVRAFVDFRFGILD